MAVASFSAPRALARSGEIWVAAADGSGARQLASGPGRRFQGLPRWSPGRPPIAFDSESDDGRWHVWTIHADGGPPRQITQGLGNHWYRHGPRDGRTIYFSAEREMGTDIWRIPASGGTAVRVTQGGSGRLGLESADGKSILYQPRMSDSPLLMVPLSGGPARQLVNCVKPGALPCTQVSTTSSVAPISLSP